MTALTPGCGSNSEARKRAAEAADPHSGCEPGTCKAGDQWRSVSCAWRGGDVETLIWAAFDAAVKAAAPDDPTGHLPNCGYVNVEHETCACPEYGARLRAGLREAITSALGTKPTEGLACCQIAVDCLTEHGQPAEGGALTEAERLVLRYVDTTIRAADRIAASAATLRIGPGDWTTVEHYVERILAARSQSHAGVTVTDEVTRWRRRALFAEDAICRAMRLYHEAVREGLTLQPTAVRDALAPQVITPSAEVSGDTEAGGGS